MTLRDALGEASDESPDLGSGIDRVGIGVRGPEWEAVAVSAVCDPGSGLPDRFARFHPGQVPLVDLAQFVGNLVALDQ